MYEKVTILCVCASCTLSALRFHDLMQFLGSNAMACDYWNNRAIKVILKITVAPFTNMVQL